MKKRTIPTLFWYVLAALLVVCDQAVKLWVRHSLPLGAPRPFIPHFLELYHVENTGAAFSLFARHTWLLALLSAVMAVVLVLALWRDWFTSNAFSRLCVSLVLAGAVGNLIDRVVRGAVTDMFNFTFMTFGVFNVADICVVGGVIGYACYALFSQVKGEAAGSGGEDGHEADAERPQ